MPVTKNQRYKRRRQRVLSLPMIDHLLTYCEWAVLDGSYFGNRVQFMNRHHRIIKWLETIRERHRRKAGT